MPMNPSRRRLKARKTFEQPQRLTMREQQLQNRSSFMKSSLLSRTIADMQDAYERAVAIGNAPPGYGKVIAVEGEREPLGINIYVYFEGGRRLSPWFDQDPSEEDSAEVRKDPELYAAMIVGGMDNQTWAESEWD